MGKVNNKGPKMFTPIMEELKKHLPKNVRIMSF